ncbi:MAG TPA: TRIC cation channel family protein [Candidatus Nanopelagicales bacterium]|nr:TRIC cation channel family protein [Candidatus Nanopelagicales bacterium]
MTDLALATPLWLAMLTIVVNALVGALHGYLDDERHWDVVGVVTFALVMGLGGGFIRDVLLGLPAQSLRTPWPVLATLVAVPLAWIVAPLAQRLPKLLGSLDAVALSLFAITGTATATAHGVPALPAILLGVVTAVGGGVLVSVLRGEVPTILVPSRPQALIAAVVGAAYLALAGRDANAAYVVSGALGVALHLVATQRDVRTRSLSAVR